jgi:RNA-directed DNA polymerase
VFTHSIGESQKKTKLDRIGELAASKKDVVFNNIGHAIDLDLLRECYRQLERKKAVGIDGITKEAYGVKLEDNLQDLLARIRKGAYKPQPSRIVEIPKEDGSTRPLAISCLEDKIIQAAVSAILTLIYEPQFLPCSYGYREGVSAHEALRALMKHNDRTSNGAIVEIDLRKYFNSIPHSILMQILQEKISDKRFLKLVETLIRSPVIEKDKVVINERGCPQGSMISPILANIFLHVCIDDWFYKVRKTHMQDLAELVRFADDMVFTFRNQTDAKRFYEVLPKRLEKFGLEMHEGKSSIITSGKKAAEEAHHRGERLPTYNFLGFTCYWGLSRKGTWRLKFKSRSDRLAAKMKGLRKHLKDCLHEETHSVLKRVIKIVKGWINYHAISDNSRRVKSFIHMCRRTLFWWRNRKGGQRKLSWERFAKLLNVVKFPKSFKVTSMFATC